MVFDISTPTNASLVGQFNSTPDSPQALTVDGGYAYIGDFGYMVILNVFNSWDGSASNDWNNSSNWDYGVIPSSNDYAIAPSGATIVVSNNISIKKLKVNAGASLSINSGSSLTVSEDVTIAGTVTVSGNIIVE